MDHSTEAGGMSWEGVVERNRKLLTGIVDMLFSLVIGLDEGKAIATLPRCTRNQIHRILRPAESALRRLIMIAARDLPALPLPLGGGESRSLGLATAKPLAFAREGAAMPNSGTVFTGSLGLAGIVHRPKERAPRSVSTRPPVFPLLDPLKHFDFTPRRRYSKSFPRITWLDGRDPTPIPDVRPIEPGDPVDATRLCRRLIALRNALENLDREARRLARWKARRDWILKARRGEFGPASEAKLNGPNAKRFRFSPMRPGYAPGRRKRQIHEIDEILKDLHLMAQYSESLNSS